MLKKVLLKSKSAEKTFRAVHISDCHLIVPDPADGELYQTELDRKAFFERESCWRSKLDASQMTRAEDALIDAVDYAKGVGAEIAIYTGDVIEFATSANLNRAAEIMGRLPYLYTFGNHDYMNYWTGKDPADKQREDKRAFFAAKIANDPDFACRKVNGVNFVVVDNSLVEFTARQAEGLKKVFASGGDVVLGFHIPLYTKSIFVRGVEELDLHSRMVSDEDVEGQAYAAGATKEFLDLIKANKDRVLGIFTGHIHYYSEDKWHGISEFVSAPTYLGPAYNGTFFDITIEKA